MRKWLLVVIVVNIAITVKAQSPDSLVFHHIQEKLSQNTITKIFQDPDGFLWFGTRYGLNKYDGQYFQEYMHSTEDSTSISDSRINDVVVDKNGNFWLATDLGVNYFDRHTGVFKHYVHDPKDPNTIIGDFTISLFMDHKDQLWIGTEGQGLSVYDKKSDSFLRFRSNDNDPYALSNNHITCINEDYHGNIWIGTRGGGLNLFDRNSQRFITYFIDNGKENSSPRVLLNSDKGLWVGTQEGLFIMNYSEEGRYEFEQLSIDYYPEESSILAKATILSMIEDRQGNLWIGTENQGLFLINRGLNRITRHFRSSEKRNRLSSNSIWSLYEDKDGILWIGTYDNGIDKIDPLHRRFSRISDDPAEINTLSYGIVSSFVEEEGQGLWVGTDGGGLNFIDYQSGAVTVFQETQSTSSLNGNAVLSLIIDKQQDLWAASWEGGVSKKVTGSSQFERLSSNSQGKNELLGPDAFYLFEDDRGNIWMSIFRDGINIYDRKSKIIRSIEQEDDKALTISSPKIKCIIQTRDGAFWLASEGMGVDRITVDENYEIIDKKVFNTDIGEGKSLSHNSITHLQEAENGDIWITTFGGGINILDPKSDSITWITKDQGLPSNVTLSIEQDKKGDMWIGTSNGLCRINTNLKIKTFGPQDGIENPEFVKSSSYINSKGELFFGSSEGFYRFHPDEIYENEKIPPVTLTGFKIAGRGKGQEKNTSLKDRYPEGEIRLNYDENDFAFDFAVLNYTQSRKNRYAYMLEGYDDQWLDSEDGYNITYTNVSPGEYTFRAKGGNNDGVWNERGASIRVVIDSPWYLSGFVFVGYGAVFLILLAFFRRGIIYRERLKNELTVEHVELTKMQEVNRLKSRFFANISHEFRTPLTLIIGPLKSLINGTYKGDSKSQYRIMARNAERLLRLINQILDLSKLESGGVNLQASKSDLIKFLKPVAHAFTSYAERQFIDYKCEFPNHELELYFEPDKIEKIAINLLSNAFKYTQEFGKIKFEVTEDAESVSIAVIDTGVGIPGDQLDFIFDRFYQIDNGKQKGSGIGLALTKELVDLHKGTIEVTSKIKEGTNFTVRLLKGSGHLDEEEIISSDKSTQRHFEEDFKELEMVKNNLSYEPIDDGNKVTMEELPLVLVAEDNDDMRMFISEYLVTNYKIIEAKNGKEALEAARENIPDVIISDIIMPEMSGYELCEKIKSEEQTSHIPIILLTAKASGESTEKGLELGADYYVTKPFNPKLLELRIKNILKTREQIRHQLLTVQEQSIEPKDLKIASKDQEFLKKAIKCVEENLSNSDFGVDDLYRELGLSRTQLYRKLKGLVGQSANEFIRSFRLKRAAQLLKQQEMTISEVTYHVGFNDLQYFRYCFKKQFGSNPSEYAQAVQ